ncbi:hypothetical protein CLPUN_00600 [Clostridium puniceum]|uniref:ABC transporter substrate-binding protein n=1 Tax=Clostridium puniceum TaxID=29367 RepID=A0A1S8TXU6_9CLOT|nr:hypothetical protein CLPUN_00600 [Clostridium puniceum]
MYRAFKGGTGDYVALFEPTASVIAKEGTGIIIASVGEALGLIPYTCYFTTKSYMDKNPKVIENFTKAIYKGQVWFFNHSTEEVANSIIQYFPGTDKEIIMAVINNYKSIDAIAHTPEIKEENLSRLMNIISDYDSSLMMQRPEFSKIVDNSYAQKVVK